MALEAYLKKLCDEMAGSWQRLPVHDCFTDAEPIPLPVCVVRYQGNKLRSGEAGEDGHVGARSPLAQSGTPYKNPQQAVERLLPSQAVTLIVGGPGAGKTTATKWLTHGFALKAQQAFAGQCDAGNADGGEQNSADACSGSAALPALVPVWVDLGECGSFASLADIMRDYSPPTDGADHINILWIFDGLDLLTGSAGLRAQSIISAAVRHSQRSGDKFIFSGRDNQDVLASRDHSGDEHRIELQSLTDELREGWISKYCPEHLATYKRFTDEHAKSREFLNVPLLFAMLLSAAMDADSNAKPFEIDQYSGRAGMFYGFVNYALARRGHNADCYRSDIVAEVFYEAIMAGYEDRFSPDKLRSFWGQQNYEEKFEQWRQSVDILEDAGLIKRDKDNYALIHQQFGEYWAACHLADRLNTAQQNGFLAAELWEHFQEKRLDPITGQAVAIAVKRYCDSIDAGDSIKYLGSEYKIGQMGIWKYIGSAIAGKLLLSVVSKREEDGTVRSAAIQTLVSLGCIGALDKIRSIASDITEDSDVRSSANAAQLCLEYRNKPGFHHILREDADLRAKRDFIASALNCSDSCNVISNLISILKTSQADSSVRRYAIAALIVLRASGISELLFSIVDDAEEDNSVRVAAVEALAILGVGCISDRLLSVAANAKQHFDVRLYSIVALTNLDDTGQSVKLLDMAYDVGENVKIRIYAIYALACLGAPGVLGDLFSLGYETKMEIVVRYAAWRAVGRLAADCPKETLAKIESMGLEYKYAKLAAEEMSRRICPPSMSEVVEPQKRLRLEYYQNISGRIGSVENYTDLRGSKINGAVNIGSDVSDSDQSVQANSVTDSELKDCSVSNDSVAATPESKEKTGWPTWLQIVIGVLGLIIAVVGIVLAN